MILVTYQGAIKMGNLVPFEEKINQSDRLYLRQDRSEFIEILASPERLEPRVSE